MGDDHHRLVRRHGVQTLLQLLLGAVVHRTRRFVEQQDRRIHQESAGDGDALTLAAGERIAALADQHVEAVRVAIDEVAQPGNLRRRDDRRVIGIRRADGDVVAQRAVEEGRILRHVADVAPEVGRIELPEVDAVDHHRALARLVKPEQQLLQGRLAGTDTANDDHFLAGRDPATETLERLQRCAGIAEFDLVEFDVAAQLRAMDETGVGGPLDRLLHDLFERGQRHLGVVVLHQQPDHLPERRDGARGQHRAGDQPAHGELADSDQIDPRDDHDDIDDLLRLQRAIGRRRRKEAHLVADAGDESHRLFPLRLHDALGALRLDRLQRRQALDQRGIAQRAGAIGGLGQFVHLVLQDVRVNDDDDDDQQHRQDELPGNQGNDQNEKQGERQVDEGGHRGRCDEIAHRLERTQVRGEGADRRRPCFHAHAEDAFHDLRRELHVDPRAGEIDEIAAQQAEHQVDHEQQDHPQRQHPQGLDRAVGNHPVIDVHHEQRHGQRDDVDQQGRAQHVAVDRPLVGQRSPEPVAQPDFADFRRAPVEAEMRPCIDGDAAVTPREFVPRELDRTLTGFREQQAGGIAGLVPAKQDTGFIAGGQQNDRQQRRVDALQRTPHDLGREPGAIGGAGEQRGCQRTLFQRQPGGQRGTGRRAPVETRQFDQAIEQRVVVEDVLAHAGLASGNGREYWRVLGFVHAVSISAPFYFTVSPAAVKYPTAWRRHGPRGGAAGRTCRKKKGGRSRLSPERCRIRRSTARSAARPG